MLYAESSAVLAWLLGEPSGRAVARLLRTEGIVASELTLLECDRVLLRAVARDQVSRQDADAHRDRLEQDAELWNVQPITSSILRRARASFPDDTIRSLDAIHIATALVARAALIELDVLSLDERIRSNATALGFRVVPG